MPCTESRIIFLHRESALALLITGNPNISTRRLRVKARRLRSASDCCDRSAPALATSHPPQDESPTHRCRLTPPLPNPLPPAPTFPPVLVPANLPASGALRVPELDGALDFVCDLGGADEVGCAPQEGNIFFIIDTIRSRTSGLCFLNGLATAIGD